MHRSAFQQPVGIETKKQLMLQFQLISDEVVIPSHNTRVLGMASNMRISIVRKQFTYIVGWQAVWQGLDKELYHHNVPIKRFHTQVLMK